MTQAGYLAHFRQPRNTGRLDQPSAFASVSNPACGDVAELYLAIEDDRIVEARFLCRGCSAAIGIMSMVTSSLPGRSIRELESFSVEDVENLVGEVPKTKRHALALARDAVVRSLSARRGAG